MTAPLAWGGTHVGQSSDRNFAMQGNPCGVVRLLAAGLNISTTNANTDFQLQLGAMLNFSGASGTPVTSTAIMFPTTWPSGQTYMISQVQLNNASAAMTATLGIYTATAAGGVTVVDPTVGGVLTSNLGTAANTTLYLPALATNAQKNVYTSTNIYARVGTAQSGATLDVYIFGVVYP